MRRPAVRDPYSELCSGEDDGLLNNTAPACVLRSQKAAITGKAELLDIQLAQPRDYEGLPIRILRCRRCLARFCESSPSNKDALPPPQGLTPCLRSLKIAAPLV